MLCCSGTGEAGSSALGSRKRTLMPVPRRSARPRPDRRSTAGAARSDRASAPSRCRPSGPRGRAGRRAAQLGIDAVVADIDADDACDDERVRRNLVAAEVDDPVDAALERGGRLGDAGRGDECRGGAGHTGDLPLVDLGPELGARGVRALGQALVDGGDRQLARLSDVPQRVLVDAGPRARADPDRRKGVERKGVEERERRQVRAPVRADGRDPGDRSRGDEAVHQTVQDGPLELLGVEEHQSRCISRKRTLCAAIRAPRARPRPRPRRPGSGVAPFRGRPRRASRSRSGRRARARSPGRCRR